MPIYEYACRKCGHRFDALVRGASEPACPNCESGDLERLLSLPAVKSDTTRGLSSRAAQTRDSSQAKERIHAQREYERNHD